MNTANWTQIILAVINLAGLIFTGYHARGANQAFPKFLAALPKALNDLRSSSPPPPP